MNRRNFILGAISSSLAIGAGAAWFSVKKHDEPLEIDVALSKLDQLITQPAVTTGQWSLYQIFTHCAQSVEYSMLAYPEQRSDLFKSTVGKAAFSLFIAKRKMTHALDEAIPGAPDFSAEEDTMAALNRFKQSLIDFKNYQGELAPHFAYGPLTKPEYEAAHVMHFNNHLQEISMQGSSLQKANTSRPSA